MLVADVMTAPAVTVDPETSIKTAARMLRDRNVAAVPVVDPKGTLVGIVSEIDLLRGSVPPDPVAHLVPVVTDPTEPPRSVADVMTRDVQFLLLHSDLYDAARLMRTSGVRSLPVLDGGQVVGMVSRSDLLRVLAREDQEIMADVLTAIAAELGPHHDWEVMVSGGVVTLTTDGAGAGAGAAALVATRVPGVVRVETSTAPQR